MASGKPRSWAWQWFTKVENGIQCNLCTPGEKIYKLVGISIVMKIHLRKKHNIFNDEDEGKWIEQTEEYYSIYKHFTKQGNYTAKCKNCDNVIEHAHNVKKIQRHLEKKHKNVIEKERQEVVKNIWLLQHFVIDKNNDTAKCNYCNKIFTIFCGIEFLSKHTCKYKNKNITSHTNMGKNSIDMILQSTSEKNNPNTSSYQPGTYSEAAENLEGEWSSTSANNDDHIATAMKIFSEDVCNTDNEKRNEMEWKKHKEESHPIWKYFTTGENYMIQQSTSEENNPTTSSYQPSTYSEAAENLEGEWSSTSANNDDHIATAMKIFSEDVCNTDNEKRNEMEWKKHKEESHPIWKYFTTGENYMIQQSTSEENNPTTSSYQPSTYSEAAENLEGEWSSMSANNGDEDGTEMDFEYSILAFNDSSFSNKQQ